MFILLLSLHSETLCLFKKKKEKEREMFVVLCICNWLYKIIINYWTLVICLFERKGRPGPKSSSLPCAWKNADAWNHMILIDAPTSLPYTHLFNFSAQWACAWKLVGEANLHFGEKNLRCRLEQLKHRSSCSCLTKHCLICKLESFSLYHGFTPFHPRFSSPRWINNCVRPGSRTGSG